MKTYEKLNTSQQNTVDSVYKHFGSEEVSQPEYIKYCQDNKLTFCFLLNKDYRVSKGLYKLPLPNQSKQVDIPEVKQEIIAALDWQAPIYEISAATQRGTKDLCYKIMQFIQEQTELETV